MISRLPAPEYPSSRSARVCQAEPGSVITVELLLEPVELPTWPTKLLMICAPLLTTRWFIAPLLPTKSDSPSPQRVLLPERNAVLVLAPGIRPRTPLPWLVRNAPLETRRLFAEDDTPTYTSLLA